MVVFNAYANNLAKKLRSFWQDFKYFELLVFVVLSSFLWTLTALSRKYTDTIILPIEFLSDKQGEILVNDLPEKLSVQVYATGFELLKHKTRIRIFPLRVNLDKYSVRRKYDTSRYDVDCNSFFSEIESSLGGTVSVKSLSPTKLVLEYSRTSFKNVAVKPSVKVTFLPQHKLSKRITANPDSVTITGPKSILDTISSVSTTKLSLKDLSAPELHVLDLVYPDHVKLSATSVEVAINVERFTEHQLQIPLKLVNHSSFEEIELMEQFITVRYIVCLSAFSSVTAQSFEAVAVAPQKDTLPPMLEVRLLKHPENISVISINPLQVDYLIKRQR